MSIIVERAAQLLEPLINASPSKEKILDVTIKAWATLFPWDDLSDLRRELTYAPVDRLMSPSVSLSSALMRVRGQT